MEAGHANSRNKYHQFWQQENHPEELITSKFTDQKLDYIHNNPVVAGIVVKAEEYLYSSARDYYEGKAVGLLQIEFRKWEIFYARCEMNQAWKKQEIPVLS